jgi:rubrerythrin
MKLSKNLLEHANISVVMCTKPGYWYMNLLEDHEKLCEVVAIGKLHETKSVSQVEFQERQQADCIAEQERLLFELEGDIPVWYCKTCDVPLELVKPVKWQCPNCGE